MINPKEMEILRIPWAIICIIFLLLGINEIRNIAEIYINDYKKIDTTGVITSLDYPDGGNRGSRYFFVNVLYEVNGEKNNSFFNGGGLDFHRGKEIDIYYYKDNIFKIGNRKADVWNTFIGIIFVFIYSIFFIIFYFLYKSIKSKR